MPRGGYAVTARADAPAAETAQNLQQTGTCTGTVLDVKGEPVIGASILITGTTDGGITDIDGTFSIEEVPVGSVLQISCIGFKTQDITWTGGPVNVILEQDSEFLDEVVVVGFGTQKKVNLTGSVSVVSAEELTARPVSSVTQAMQGLVPGMNFSYSGSGAGRLDSNMSINIHGTGTIGQGSSASPLILIDGAEGDMNAINPQDIESISVLKDASSASIYGSRAAFGVVLITTKKGHEGRVVVNYNNNFRFTNAIQMPKNADSYTYAKYFNLMRQNSGMGVQFDDARLEAIKGYLEGDPNIPTTYPNRDTPTIWDWIGNTNTDWYDVVFGDTAFTHEHNISASGGSEKVQFYMSGNYLDQTGLVAINSDKLKRYTVSGKINAQLFPWLKAMYSIKYIRRDYSGPSTLDLDGNLYHNIAKRWPMEPVYDPNGHVMSNTIVLPLMYEGTRKRQTDNIYNQFQLVAEPVKGWNIIGEINYNVVDVFEHTDKLRLPRYNVDNSLFYDTENGRGQNSVQEFGSRNNYFNTSVRTEYAHSFNDAHNLKVMVGFQSELNQFKSLTASRMDLITENVPEIPVATGEDDVNSNHTHWATAGFFGRVNYDYKGRYLFEANIRYDGTSRFARDRRWNWFPSFSAGWNIAQEDFWEPFRRTVSMFKLTGSWGQLGNQNTNSLYPYILTMPFTFQGSSWLINGEKPDLSSDPGLGTTMLGWETMQSWKVGLDLAMFDNRLTLDFEWFNRKTLNMVGPAEERPDILGTSVPNVNNADMVSSGFDLDIAWRDQVGDFSYGIHFLLSDARQKVLRYPNETNLLSTWREGQYLGEIWGYETIGIAKSDEEMEQHLASLPDGGQNALGSQWAAGDIMYKDLNGDGRISGGSTSDDPQDLKIIGNNTPRFNYGLDLTFGWKGIDLRIFLQGTAKRDYWIGDNTFFGAQGGTWQASCFDYHLDFFTTGEEEWNDYFPANLDAYYPRPLENGSKNQQTQTRYLQNAAYMRLKNLQLGYTFPRHLTEKAGISNLRIFVSGDNIWTVSSLPRGIDPETVGSSAKVYPLSRNWSFGINVTF